MKRLILFLLLFLPLGRFSARAQDWIPLFDGKTLNGWRPSENKGTWRVEDGMLVSRGGRSHLFYEGDVHHHDFKNFEFRAEVKTTTASNSGIYLHTHYQETDFPETGYECQVINGYPANPRPDQYVERKMTSSIYAIRNVWKSPARDGDWFRYRIFVQGKTIRTYVNDELMADYTESEHPFRPADKKGRLLSSGTFALQGHDAGSVVFFRKIEVKPMPDNLPTPGTPTDDPAFNARIIQLSDDNFPLLDLDVQTGHGLILDQAMSNARKFGYTYGFVFSDRVPAGFRKPSDAYVGLKVTGSAMLDSLKNPSPGEFDYVIARTGFPASIGHQIPDPQTTMENLIRSIEKIAASKRVNILGDATALPENLRAEYDALWTPERMDRVIHALKAGQVAVEINDRLKVPSAAFIKRAKAAGLRFTFGSGNTSGDDLGRLAYCIDMVEQCHLSASDLWLP